MTDPSESRRRVLAAHEAFEQQAATSPSVTALVCRQQRFAYREVNERANRVAHYLRSLECAEQSCIGLYMARSADAVIACLGILKAGHICVPLDPQVPAVRLHEIIADARIDVVVASPELVDALPRYRPGLTCTVPAEIDAGYASSNLSLAIRPDDPAYVSYTSGSTGRPKGVICSHRHLCHAAPASAAADVVALNTSLAFAACLTRLWPPLLAGGTLVVVPEEDMQDDSFLRTIERERVSAIGLVPTALRQLLNWIRRGQHRARSIRKVTVAGAPLTQTLVDEFFACMPHARMFYAYGASELGPVTSVEVTPGPFDPACIGRPLPKTHVLILDDSLRPVPIGQIGEMYVSSSHMTLAYLNDPELTRERYLPNIWSADAELARVFRTGDLGRYRPDGQLTWEGRVDHQVKIRGSRVELRDVETQLAKHPRVAECVVSVAIIADENHLVAYVVRRNGMRASAHELRDYLKKRVPAFMVPSGVIALDSVPLTPNGKIDRQALPALQLLRGVIDTPYVEPRNNVERVIAGIWQQLLAIDLVGVDDHFLDLGGDSLFATRAVAAVLDRFGIEDTTWSLFEYSTVAALAREVQCKRPVANAAAR